MQQSCMLGVPVLMCSLYMENYFGIGSTNNYNMKTLPVKSDKHTYSISTIILIFYKIILFYEKSLNLDNLYSTII